jgi:uncharacterized membrane protein
MTNQQRTEQYLSAFSAALRSTPEPQHGEILREITAHIRDAAEEPGSTVSTVLARLGPPEALARQYGEGALLQTARSSLSPLLLLRAALRLATKGILGFVVFCCAMSGYLTGAGMILSALAKPFFPSAIGMWRPTPHSIAAGMVAANVQPMHEVLGWWYIPLALGIGVVLILVTTLIVRGCLWMSSLTDSLGPHLTLGLASAVDRA